MQNTEKKGPTPAFFNAMNSIFPGAIEYKLFIAKMQALLSRYGFNKKNTVPLVSVCRDELTKPFVTEMDKQWGNTFDISSLAGLVFCGKTGMKAGMSHAPIENGLARYLFLAGPHIAISADGKTGIVQREGQSTPGHACGAIYTMEQDIAKGTLSLLDDHMDAEYSLMKQHMIGHLRFGQSMDLVSLTYWARICAEETCGNTVVEVLRVINKPCCYAFCTYIMIHGPDGSNYIWVGSFNYMYNGGSSVMDLRPEFNQICALPL